VKYLYSLLCIYSSHVDACTVLQSFLLHLLPFSGVAIFRVPIFSIAAMCSHPNLGKSRVALCPTSVVVIS